MARLIPITLRHMVKADAATLEHIELKCFDHPWTVEEFLAAYRKHDCVIQIAEWQETVVGYMVYELHDTRFHLLSLAVHPRYRHRRVGSQMLTRLASTLAINGRKRILLEVRETNLEAQLFLKAHGFKATRVLRDYYEDSREDAYSMQFSLADRGSGVREPAQECQGR